MERDNDNLQKLSLDNQVPKMMYINRLNDDRNPDLITGHKILEGQQYRMKFINEEEEEPVQAKSDTVESSDGEVDNEGRYYSKVDSGKSI